jgi:hypothetical protein
MNMLTFTCALFLMLLLAIMLFASSVKWIFTPDELSEMGVDLETLDSEAG